jgi:hypothetical protein
MDEARMRAFLDEAPIPGRGTFFCTQQYACLEETIHELAPHPYLGPGGEWQEELRESRARFPHAVGWRSHSCVFSHILAEQLARDGYRYVSVHDEPGSTEIRPVRHAWGLWHLPIYYMDNLDFSATRFWGNAADSPFRAELIDAAVAGDGLFVFDFHPIHLALNSPSADEYFVRRELFERGALVDDVRYDGRGSLTFYLELIEAMEAADTSSIAMGEAIDLFTSGVHAREPR